MFVSILITSTTSKCKMEIDRPPQRSGYSLKLFVDPKLAETFICTICKNVLKNAVQIPESLDPKRACQDCYKDNIRYVFRVFFCSVFSRIWTEFENLWSRSPYSVSIQENMDQKNQIKSNPKSCRVWKPLSELNTRWFSY